MNTQTITRENLDTIAVDLQERLDKTAKKDFLAKRSTADTKLKLSLDIVVDILNTKVAEEAAAKTAAENKAHNQKILEHINDKKEESLKGKSIEELEAMLK